jgi:hypothetical protein
MRKEVRAVALARAVDPAGPGPDAATGPWPCRTSLTCKGMWAIPIGRGGCRWAGGAASIWTPDHPVVPVTIPKTVAGGGMTTSSDGSGSPTRKTCWRSRPRTSGGISLAASLLSTLSGQCGNGYFRFVARAHSADPRWPTYAMAGGDLPRHLAVAGGCRRPGRLAGRPAPTVRRAAPTAGRRGLAAGGPWFSLVVGPLSAAGSRLGDAS